MEKILKTTLKVRFQDCDPFNHLNNSKYIDYFINAREDQILEHYNIDAFDYGRKTGKTWLVASSQIMYLKPANTHETVVIESTLKDYSERTILVEMKMWNAHETQLKAIFWIRFVHFDLQTQKRADHPADMMELFENVVVRDESESFEKRCAVLRASVSKS